MIKFLRFIITNTYKACIELLKDIIKFVTRVLEPITFPWAAAHMTQVYYEITNFYLNMCIKKEVPFIEPTTSDLAYTTTHIKETCFYGDIKDKMTYDLGRGIKLFLTPYSIAAPYRLGLKEMKGRVVEHNSKFTDVQGDELDHKMMAALDIYNSIFGGVKI